MPRIRIFGGVHHCPGCRLSLLRAVTGETAPALIAVEWGDAPYQSVSAARAVVEEAALERWPFLTATSAYELSAALGWEAEVPMRLWPNVEVVWLEDEWQVDDLRTRYPKGCDEYAEAMTGSLVRRISVPSGPTLREFFDAPPDGPSAPPEPTSLDLLIDRLWHKSWAEVENDENDDDLHRDERWLRLLEPRFTELREGWVALVVGWRHADPSAPGRLRQLLTQRGFEVESVRLGP